MSLKKQSNFIKTMKEKKNIEKMKFNKMSMDSKHKWKLKINQELT